MDCFTDIDLTGADLKNLSVMTNTTLDCMMRFWLDDAKTDPDDLTTSTFSFKVVDSTGAQILLLTTANGGGLTVSGQDLIFNKALGNLAVGKYFYVLMRTVAGNTNPEVYGDFVLTKNA